MTSNTLTTYYSPLANFDAIMEESINSSKLCTAIKEHNNVLVSDMFANREFTDFGNYIHELGNAAVNTLFEVAIRYSNLDIAKKLYEHYSSSIYAFDLVQYNSPLVLAVAIGNSEILSYLIEIAFQNSVNFNPADDEFRLFTLAVRYGHSELAMQLYEDYATSPRLVYANNFVSLDAAIQTSNTYLLKWMLSVGGNIETVSASYEMLISEACCVSSEFGCLLLNHYTPEKRFFTLSGIDSFHDSHSFRAYLEAEKSKSTTGVFTALEILFLSIKQHCAVEYLITPQDIDLILRGLSADLVIHFTEEEKLELLMPSKAPKFRL